LNGFCRALVVLGLVALTGVGLVASIVVHGVSARDEPTAVATVVARAVRNLAVPSNLRRMTNPVPASAEVVAQGRAHFADHCALCHANDGSGQTTIGRNLYPKAPDMRLAATQSLSDGALFATRVLVTVVDSDGKAVATEVRVFVPAAPHEKK
jgi:mono/diheme cytochrome c family protein